MTADAPKTNIPPSKFLNPQLKVGGLFIGEKRQKGSKDWENGRCDLQSKGREGRMERDGTFQVDGCGSGSPLTSSQTTANTPIMNTALSRLRSLFVCENLSIHGTVFKHEGNVQRNLEIVYITFHISWMTIRSDYSDCSSTPREEFFILIIISYSDNHLLRHSNVTLCR